MFWRHRNDSQKNAASWSAFGLGRSPEEDRLQNSKVRLKWSLVAQGSEESSNKEPFSSELSEISSVKELQELQRYWRITSDN